MASIRFGTDGWRGIIAEDFTFANARIVAQAIARYAVRNEDARQGLLIGYDHRFAADRVAAEVAEVISSTGTPVFLATQPCPTPAISLLVRQLEAAGGLMITASHNPYSWNGIKYSTGGAPQFSPARERWVSAPRRASAVGAPQTLCLRRIFPQPCRCGNGFHAITP